VVSKLDSRLEGRGLESYQMLEGKGVKAMQVLITEPNPG